MVCMEFIVFFCRKLVSLDMKLENRLNMKDLDRLQDAFMVGIKTINP